MNCGKRIVGYILCLVIGAVLIALGAMGIADAYWSGMGTSLIVVSIVFLIRWVRVQKNESYREQVETEVNDERNRYIRNKAWAWAGYLFVLVAAVASIVLRVLGQTELSQFAGYAVCLLVVLYWISYVLLRKKY